MTTGRWMVFFAVVSAELALLTFVMRFAAAKVAAFMQQVRSQAGLAPDAPLTDFNVPVTQEIMNWIEFSNFLSRFWIVHVVLIVLLTLGATAWFPRRVVQPRTGPPGAAD